MNEFLRRVVGGFGMGLGFSLAAVVVIYLATGMLMEKTYEEAYAAAEDEAPESFGYQRYSADSGLSIKSHRDRKLTYGMEILAEIENTGDTTWSSVSVEAELFDAEGSFVDECSGYLRGRIAPGEVKNVKIECGGCKDSPLAEYARYTIEIADASAF